MKILDTNGLTELINIIKNNFAKLNSPALTGTPTAPTPTSGDNSTQIATTAFVQATANAMAGGAHTHNTSNIEALTGYEKPETTSALSTSDTLNGALGKLERALDGKQDALDELTPEEILVLWNTYFRVPVTVTVSQSTGQTITVTVNETDYTATFTAPTGAEYTATLTPDTGYTAGTLSSESGTLTENVTISATAATLQTFTFTLPATENQTITLTYTEPDSTAQTITSTNTAQEITLDYGTTWTASAEGTTGYTAGTLSAASGTITDDIELTITEATVATFDLTLAATENQTITLTYTEPDKEAQIITSTNTAQTITVGYGTTWTATVTAAEGYNAGTLSADSGTVTAATTVSTTEAILSKTPLNLYQYAQNNIDSYESVTTLPQTNIEELTNITPMSNMSKAFFGCSELTSLSNVETTWDTSNVTNMTRMFEACYELTSLNLSNWDTSNVTNVYYMFSECSRLTSLDLSNWDTSNLTAMRYMFGNGCSSLTVLDLSNWDTTNNYPDISTREMFDGCSNLQYLIIGSSTFKFRLPSPDQEGNYIMLNSNCKILVPQALLSTYQNDRGWLQNGDISASQFDAIENYTITRSNGQVTVTPKS